MSWHKVAETPALDGKDVIAVEIEGREIAIYRLNGEYFATANICTHQFAFMSEGYVMGDCIECPLHQALFDIRSGGVVEGPAEQPLEVYPVKVDGDTILIQITK